MGFNRRKLKDRENVGRLTATWNERQTKRMTMLFSPTIGAAIPAGYWFFVGPLPGLRHDERDRPPHARSSPRRGRIGSHLSGHIFKLSDS